VLWLPDDDFGFVIESKGNKKAKNALGKTEHGQLLVSAEWFKQQYPNRTCLRVHLHPNDRATEPAMAKDTYVLTLESLSKVVCALRALLAEVCLAMTTTQARLALCEKLLRQHRLTPREFTKTYLSKFIVA
jgi:hypothetical protein